MANASRVTKAGAKKDPAAAGRKLTPRIEAAPTSAPTSAEEAEEEEEAGEAAETEAEAEAAAA